MEEKLVQNDRCRCLQCSEMNCVYVVLYSRNGYISSVDADSLTVHSGPNPITLQRAELERLELAIRDDYQVPLAHDREEAGLIPGIHSDLTEALSRCEGPSLSWTRCSGAISGIASPLGSLAENAPCLPSLLFSPLSLETRQ